jgi:hypothetical protein
MKQLGYLLALLLIDAAAWLATAGCQLLDWSLPVKVSEYRITQLGKKELVRGVLPE